MRANNYVPALCILFSFLFFLVDCESPDDAPPLISITTPADASIVTGDTLIKVDASDDTAVECVTFYAGAVLLFTDTITPYEYTWELNEADNAAYTIMVVAEDTSGNTAAAAVTITVAIDADVTMPVPSVFPDIFPHNALLSFTTATPEADIFTGISNGSQATEPDSWIQESGIILDEPGAFTIFARSIKTGLPDSVVFSELITVAAEFPPAAGQEGTSAVSMDDPSIVGWATGYENYTVGEDCVPAWQTPEKALGEAVGDSYDIVCLGNGGEITVTFDNPVTNGDGPDFIVFENSITDTFLEFAYVEVSSNGTDFIRFDCVSLTASPVDAFGVVQPEHVTGLAGKYRQGFGTPFDLSRLTYREKVRNGTVNITNITHIRFIDIWGNPESGTTDYDSFGNIIYDLYRCVGSGGFDLDAVGILYQLEAG